MAVTCQSFLVCSTDLIQKGVYRPTAARIRQGAPQCVGAPWVTGTLSKEALSKSLQPFPMGHIQNFESS